MSIRITRLNKEQGKTKFGVGVTAAKKKDKTIYSQMSAPKFNKDEVTQVAKQSVEAIFYLSKFNSKISINKKTSRK